MPAPPSRAAGTAFRRARPRITTPAAASALLEAARAGETEAAERATGYYWGEPRLRPHVERLRAAAEQAGDERLEQLARRFLR
jgi:hypothetical protein